jgi:hypothetical protein
MTRKAGAATGIDPARSAGRDTMNLKRITSAHRAGAATRSPGRRRPAAAALTLAAVLLALLAGGCGSSGSSSSSSAAGAATPSKPATEAAKPASGIPQNNGGDHDTDNNGGPSDGDGEL